MPSRPNVEDYEEFFEGSDLITLHGYLRILPAEICRKYTQIYNGHPALISHYPELKGLDKQEDVWFHKDKYPYIGSVIHQCTEELDAGQILYACQRENNVVSLDDAYLKLRTTSLRTWLEFFSDLNNQGLQVYTKLFQL